MKNIEEIVKDSPELTEFFEEIQGWMNANDYECGELGSEIYDKISKILGRLD